jgi:hypothetical protein
MNELATVLGQFPDIDEYAILPVLPPVQQNEKAFTSYSSERFAFLLTDKRIIVENNKKLALKSSIIKDIFTEYRNNREELNNDLVLLLIHPSHSQIYANRRRSIVKGQKDWKQELLITRPLFLSEQSCVPHLISHRKWILMHFAKDLEVLYQERADTLTLLNKRPRYYYAWTYLMFLCNQKQIVASPESLHDVKVRFWHSLV